MKKRRNDRKWYAKVRPARATWLGVALICAILVTFLGGSMLRVNAEETTDCAEQTQDSDDSAQTGEEDTDTEEAASATGSAERGIAVSGTDETSITQTDSGNGVYVSKSLSENGDGTLQVELENYVTGQTYYGDEPADIVMLLDTSWSMRADLTSDVTRAEAMEEAAINFIDAIVERNTGLDEEYQSRIAIMIYNTYTVLECDFTYATEDTRDDLVSCLDYLNYTNGTYMDTALETVRTDLLEAEAEEGREQVLVFFTDGYPNGKDATGHWHAGFVKAVANRCLVQGQAMKADGVKLFCISIHPLAESDYTELPEYEDIDEDYFFTQWDVDNGDSDTITTTVENAAAIANRFMYLLSSYNPDALTVDDDGVTYSEDGTTYYYTADSVSELIEAFLEIAQTSGLAYVELGAETETVDYITDDFQLADASLIRVYTSDYLGNGSWGERVDITDQVTITATAQSVSVSGFDYSANYVSEDVHPDTDSYYGCKLIISFPIVPADTFGGNGLATNTEDSGIYTEDSDDPIITYPVPHADVELLYEIETADRVVYVPDTVALSDLVTWADGYVPDGSNNAYVDITYTMTDEEGTVVGTLTIPAGTAASDCSWDWITQETSSCGTYTISCTVTPIESGTYESITRSAGAEAHVLHPVLTFADTTLQQGDCVDVAEGDLLSEDGLEEHLVSLKWVCDDGCSPEELNAQESPQLGYRVALPEGVEEQDGQNIITTTEDIPIVIGVYLAAGDSLGEDLTSYTEFVHMCSRSDCGYDAESQGSLGIRCLIHVEGVTEETQEETLETPENPQEEDPEEEPEEDPDEEEGETDKAEGETDEAEKEAEEDLEEEEAVEEEEPELSPERFIPLPQFSDPAQPSAGLAPGEPVTADSSSASTTSATSAASEEVSTVLTSDAAAAAEPAVEEVVPAEEAAAEEPASDIAEEAPAQENASDATHSVSATGDDAQWLLWTFLAAAAALLLAICLILHHRRGQASRASGSR